jgi:polyhydroxyalkanoate synthesis regulator phasin
MEKFKEAMLTDYMEGFEQKVINYKDYEVSFRRWLVSQIDSGSMSMQEAREHFHLHPTEYKRIIKRWQERYSDELHLSLQSMSTKDRTDNSKLEKRIKELEKQLELAKMKNVALNTMIDIAEHDYKLEIRKKSGPKQ